MPLTDSDLVDLGKAVLKDLGRLKFNQIATTLQKYEVMSRIMRKDKVQFDGGNGIQRNIMVDHSNAAKQVGLFEEDTLNVGDVLAQMDIPWRHTTTNYAYERHEILVAQGDAEKVVDIIKVRRIDAMISLAKLMEEQFWSKPLTSADKLEVFGVPYWVCKNAATGFNGGDPAGFASGAGNMAVADYPRWQNYTAQYTAVTKADLIKSMRKAYRQIQFESPVDIPDYRNGRGDQFRLYVNEDTLETMEDVGEAANENLGRDLAPFDDTITFRRNPIVWVPFLDDDTSDPVYMINFAWFYPVFLKGDYLRETDPKIAAKQHNVFEVFVDCTWNLLCTDRRSQAVLSK